MGGTTPHVVAFCCQNAVTDDLSLTAEARLAYEPEVRVAFLPCSSKVETLGIIKAFEAGAEGVLVFGCDGSHCRMTDGNKRARRIVNHTKKLLAETGIEPTRLSMFTIESGECASFHEAALAMTRRIASLSEAS